MATATLSPLVHYLRSVGPAEPDAALLARFARTGDESGFAELVRRHGPNVLGVCRRILRDGHAAEDAFQATFLLLATKAGSLRQPERLANWLHGVAYRTATKLRSRLFRRQTRERPFDESSFIPADAADADLAPELDSAIQQLPSKYRIPFVLCYLQGLSNAEAAARLGCPTNTVATRLSRARERLRSRLTNRGLTVAVSASLVATTARGAVALIAGTVGATSEILILMEGVRTAMMWKKVKLVIATVAILTLTGFGATRLAFRATAEPPASPGPSVPALPAPVADSSPRAKDERIPPLDVTASDNASKNFDVSGTTANYCHEIARLAEVHRASLAKLWLGKELLDWPKPCPVKVTISTAGASGATTFAFDSGSGAPSHMALTGSVERILNSQLPHEIAHTVLASHFRQPVPRWADEGVAVLSEDEPERKRYDEMVVQLLNAGRGMRLSYLFKLKEYPSEVMILYAQGYSVTRFLVEKGGHTRFLEFVQTGMKDGWTVAARSTYNIAELNDLEKEWLDWLRKGNREMPAAKVALPPKSKSQSDAPPVTPPPLPAAPPLPGQVELPPAPPMPSQPAPAMVAPAPVASGLTIVQAALDDDGNIVCRFSKGIQLQPMTTSVRDKSGNLQTVTSYVRTSHQEERIYRLDHLEIIGTDGKPLDANEVAKRLKKETAVLFVHHGSIGPQWLALLKEGTLIITSRVSPAPSPPPPVRK